MEVGTTGRTRLSDFANVVDEAAMLLKVHPNSYYIEGLPSQSPLTSYAVGSGA